MTPREEGLYQLKGPRHPHPAERQPLGLPHSGFGHSMVASQGWDTAPVGAEGTGIWSHEPHTGPLGMGKGHSCSGWAPHPLGTSTPQIPAPATPLQLCGVPWGGRAHGGRGGSGGGRIAAAHPQQAPLPAAAATLLFRPEPAQTTGAVVVGAAGRSWLCQRSWSPETPHSPTVPGWDRCPVLNCDPGTDPHRGCGPSLGHQAGAEPPSGMLVAHTWLQHVDHGASLSLCPGRAALLQSSTTGFCVSLRPAPEGHWGLGKVLLPWWAPAAPAAPGHCPVPHGVGTGHPGSRHGRERPTAPRALAQPSRAREQGRSSRAIF